MVPRREFEDGLNSFDNDEDALAMCNTTFLDPDKDVHIYVDHVIDDMSEIPLTKFLI